VKRKIRLGILFLFLLYSGWFIFQVLSFQTLTGDALQVFSDEIKGVFHIHTTLSDGKKSPESIARIAADKDLDFIILTDHGNPNYESLAEEGWKNGVLVLTGSELSVNRGHLSGLGFDTPEYRFSHTAEEAASQIARLNGISIVAHPYSKVSWTWGDLFLYSGIEIMNADSSVRREVIRSLPYLPAALIKPDLFLVKILERPAKNLRKWDALNRKQEIYSYFATDAHFYYGPLFRLFRLHIILKAPLPKEFNAAKQAVCAALKNGRFYNAVDSAARAEGFRFFGMNGEKKIDMGKKLRFTPSVSLHIQAPYPYKKSIHLIRNGKVISETSENTLSFSVKQPGVYRVEVYLRGRTAMGKKVPWILSNPIFLR